MKYRNMDLSAYLFQFHMVRLKVLPIQKHLPVHIRFNSYMVRLKAVDSNNAETVLNVSIPIWFD